MKLSNLGVMQGRLSPSKRNKIQFFPTKDWPKEFQICSKLGIKYIEWTLDHRNLYKNPIFTNSGIKKINFLKKKNKIKIQTLTGDCFMQKPFWKTKKNDTLIIKLKDIIEACSNLNIKYIIFPLVDNSSLKSKNDENKVINQFLRISSFLKKKKVNILFESDFKPLKLKKFIERLNSKCFGINYDSGNSASLGFNIDDEFRIYGKHIKNIHIKDRFFQGTTVRLGYGNVNFRKLLTNIKRIKYKNLFILQTARSKNNNHVQEIKINKEFLKKL